MSEENNITIQAVIINQIKKVRGQTSEHATPPVIRPKLHKVDNKLNKLINLLDDQQESFGLAHSSALNFTTSATLSTILNNYLFNNGDIGEDKLEDETDQEHRYRKISSKLTQALHTIVYKGHQTTGDHLPIIFYKEDNVNYLYIALLSLENTITIDAENGELLDTTLIDIKALKIAFKINLDQMKLHAENDSSSNNYVAWIQRGNEEISRYIQSYIPVKYTVDDKTSTRKFMGRLTGYLKSSDFDNDSSAEIYNDVLTLLKNKAASKEAVNIVEDIDPIIEQKAVALGIDIADKKSFKFYREENGYGSADNDASHIFLPSTEALRRHETFTLSVGTGISFEKIKITGKNKDIGHTIDLDESDPNQAYIRIKVENKADLAHIQNILNPTKSYESDSEED